MIIINDLIFMAVDSWFNGHILPAEENVLAFADEDEVNDFVAKVNSNFSILQPFDNFHGGGCVVDDTRQSLTIILFLEDDDEEIYSCAKNYEIIY